MPQNSAIGGALEDVATARGIKARYVPQRNRQVPGEARRAQGLMQAEESARLRGPRRQQEAGQDYSGAAQNISRMLGGEGATIGRGSRGAPRTIASEPSEGRGPSRPRGRGAALSMLSTAMATGLQKGRRRRRKQAGPDVSQDLTQAAMNPQKTPGGPL